MFVLANHPLQPWHSLTVAPRDHLLRSPLDEGPRGQVVRGIGLEVDGHVAGADMEILWEAVYPQIRVACESRGEDDVGVVGR